MLNGMRVRSSIVLALSVLLVLSAMAPASFAKSRDPSTSVVVVDYLAEGNVVHVTVKNLSRTAQTVYVFADVTVGGMTVRGVTPVSVSSKGEAETVVGFTAVVEDVGSVGIIDDSDPF